jgi:glycine amidinotransferase
VFTKPVHNADFKQISDPLGSRVSADDERRWGGDDFSVSLCLFFCIAPRVRRFIGVVVMPTIVNSWNEWDPLKHVIVGRADDCHIPPEEPALDAKVPEDSDMRGQWGRRPQETIDRANELLDNFAALLEARGITVDRPTPTDFSLPASTPDFHTESQFGCMPPRDVLLTLGHEIVEATMSYRCRWFEYLCYRPLLQKYWEDDPQFRHEAAPKPRLTDADYHADYLSEKIGVEKRLQWTAEKFFVTTEEEPLFDAADVLRFGKDLVVQHGFTTNLKGIMDPAAFSRTSCTCGEFSG